MEVSTTDRSGLAAEILTYFMENPEAVADLEGVSGWRLLGARVRATVESTQQVLDLLVSQGYLKKIETARGPMFQINREKLAEAKDFLQHGSDV